jgi:hypothetical protein
MNKKIIKNLLKNNTCNTCNYKFGSNIKICCRGRHNECPKINTCEFWEK